jgi:hypothetical protein
MHYVRRMRRATLELSLLQSLQTVSPESLDNCLSVAVVLTPHPVNDGIVWTRVISL